MVPSGVHVEVALCHRAQLRNLRQGTASDHASVRRMAPLLDGRRRRRRNLDGLIRTSSISDSLQKLNRRQARWVTELAEYHFVLSPQTRRPQQEGRLIVPAATTTTKGRTTTATSPFFPPAHFRALIMPTTNEVHTKVEEATRLEELWDRGNKDFPRTRMRSIARRRTPSNTMDAFTYPDNTRSAARSSPNSTTTSLPVIRALRKTKELVLREILVAKDEEDC